MSKSVKPIEIVVIDRSEDLLPLLRKDLPVGSVHHLDPAITPQVRDDDLLQDQIVVLNLSSPNLQGERTARELASRSSNCQVICLLSENEPESLKSDWSGVSADLLFVNNREELVKTARRLSTERKEKEKRIALERENLQLKKEIRDLETIGEVSRSVTSTLLIEEILTEILAGIRHVLGLERVLLGLVNVVTCEEEIKVSLGVPESGETRTWRISREDPVWRSILDGRRPVLLNSVGSTRLPGFIKEIFTGVFVKAPMVVKDQIIGTIMGSRSASALDERDLRLLQIFVEYAAIALENGRLYYDVIRSEQELKKAQEQLLAAEKLAVIGQLAISINHEINNPLCNISLINQILKHELARKAPELLKRLDGIDESVERIQRVAERVAHIKSTDPTEYLPNQLMIDLE